MGDTAYMQWATPDEPEPLLAVGMKTAIIALCAALGLCVLLYCSCYALRVLRSWHAARQLLEAEEAHAKSMAQSQPIMGRSTKSVHADTVTRRFCRLCDVPVDDEHVDTHLNGKKHKKLVSSQQVVADDGRLVPAANICCWVHREVHVHKTEEPPPAEEVLPLSSASTAVGGKGKWEQVVSKGKGANDTGKRRGKWKGA